MVAVGALAWATVVVTTWALGVPLLSAATAAAAAPSTSTATAPRIVAAERQLGVPRLPGPPAPHCRHQSWPAAIALPQRAQLRSAGATGGGSASGGG